MIFGAVLTATGLQFFLLPNHLLDGGVTGLSIISSRFTGLPLGFFLLAMNIPFIVLGYRKFGKEFAGLSILGIVVLASLTLLHVGRPVTEVPILAAVFGGVVVGVGVGVVVRYGGIIDGADTVAVLIDRITIFSVGEAIMVINGFIIMVSGLVFGWDTALYSLVAYYMAHKAIDVTVEGLDESRSAWIVSLDIRKVGKAISDLIDEPVTYIKESNLDDDEPHGVLLAVITRFEEQKVIKAARMADPRAFITIAQVHEVMGKISENSLYRDRPLAEKAATSNDKALSFEVES